MNIAITGSKDFIGSTLLNLLEKESSYSFFSFDKKMYSSEKNNYLNEFVMNKDIIIHLAGETEKEELTTPSEDKSKTKFDKLLILKKNTVDEEKIYDLMNKLEFLCKNNNKKMQL